MWFTLAMVAFGGAIGSLARYGVSVALPGLPGWPWHTFAVNIVGCLLIGLVLGWMLRTEGSTASAAVSTSLTAASKPENLRLFLVTGVLGGFTTFSAFGWETFRLLQLGKPLIAFTYALASIVLGVAAVAVGWKIMH